MLANQPSNAVFALIMGAICAAVAYGRWRIAPISARRTAEASGDLRRDRRRLTIPRYQAQRAPASCGRSFS